MNYYLMKVYSYKQVIGEWGWWNKNDLFNSPQNTGTITMGRDTRRDTDGWRGGFGRLRSEQVYYIVAARDRIRRRRLSIQIVPIEVVNAFCCFHSHTPTIWCILNSIISSFFVHYPWERAMDTDWGGGGENTRSELNCFSFRWWWFSPDLLSARLRINRCFGELALGLGFCSIRVFSSLFVHYPFNRWCDRAPVEGTKKDLILAFCNT